MHRRWPLVAMAVLLLAAPPALADALRVESAHAAAFSGSVALSAHEPGAFHMAADAVGLQAVFANATGRLTLVTWTRYETPVGDPMLVEPPDNETVALASQPFALVADLQRMTVQGMPLGGGEVRVEGGPVSGEGRPGLAAAPHNDQFIGPQEAEHVPVSWPAGWAVAGIDGSGTVTWPLPSQPVLAVEGRVRFQAFGGAVEFTGPDGQARRVPLGEVDEPALAGEVGAIRVRRLIFDGTVGNGTLPLQGSWTVAAPALEWSVDGLMRWTDATGEAVVDGRRHSFSGADVLADIAARGDARPNPVPLLEDRYGLDGEMRSLSADGVALSRAPPSLAAPAAAASLLAFALALLTKAGQAALASAAALFSRIPADRLDEHPARRRILDLAAAEPGIHLRELHRRLGGAWGPFTFHLHLLEKGRRVRLVRDGKFTAVLVEGSAAPAVAHPVARAVLEALPGDGNPVDLATLARRVGRARTVIGYHVDALVKRGLAERRPMPGRRRGVARVRARPSDASEALGATVPSSASAVSGHARQSGRTPAVQA